MSLSEPFVRRPVGTSLLTAAIALSGTIAFQLLSISPLPAVDFTTIQVSAGLPGASPETMASSVATPLERQFGRIAGVSEMTSASALGTTSIVLQFELGRNIDAAARDVQAAINAARGNLPSTLPSNPTYRKVNPSDSPILVLNLTSDVMGQAQMYDMASSILMQKLSQIQGVGQVFVGGSSLPAVRVELNPAVVNKYGLRMKDLATTLAKVNAITPKGELAGPHESRQLYTTDQLFTAKEYAPLIVSYAGGRPVRLADLGTVTDSVQDLRNIGIANGKPAILLVIFRQPGANIIDTVDSVYAVLPQLRAAIPPSMKIGVMVDRTTTIRAAIKDVEFTLLVSIALVILVVFLFLRNFVATLIPSVVVPLSLVGTFGVMYLLGFSLNNLSLMALTISTGFVVDDAIVVIENVSRYLEMGMTPLDATLKGAAEIGFTVLSMSLSLIAVFIPILMMGGIVGRLFHEFAITLSIAIVVSMVVSLTATPMMCAKFLTHQDPKGHGKLYEASERLFQRVLDAYAAGLRAVLDHPRLTMLVLGITVTINVFLFYVIPKGFFPQQDTGIVMGGIQAEQDISFQAMSQKVKQFAAAVQADPDVSGYAAFSGGRGAANTGLVFGALTDPDKRKTGVDVIIGRLRKSTSGIPGARLFMQAIQDVKIGGRSSNAQYQFTLQSADLALLSDWAPRIQARLRQIKKIVDLNTDQQNNGLETWLTIDRDSASRLGLTANDIDQALYSAFGQRPVSTMYAPMNQYYVVMEVAPQYWQSPDTLKTLKVRNSKGQDVPLSAFTRLSPGTTPLVVNHQGLFPAVTLSFNLPPGVALGDAVDAINAATAEMHMPASITSQFSGTAQAYQDSIANEPVLILTALIAVYIVLGVLYESYIHPITILSTLPSAGVGALLALMICRVELSLIALIGIILLIGIVKKNAILMIDFALDAQRREGKNARDAIYEACLLRFRPITMTTMAALLGAFPLAFGTGTGSELRRPLGIAIVGGLVVSQMLTLFTTPVVYLYMDELPRWFAGLVARWRSGEAADPEFRTIAP
jgi:multidrug efflux pump